MLAFALLGLGAGAVYALLGQGIVMIYRGSGVLNLSHGALAMLAAYIFGLLRVDRAWALVPAAAVAILAVALIGVATDVLLLRHLGNASPLTRLIATLGVFLVVYAGANIKWGINAPLVSPIFPSSPESIFGASVRQDVLWTLGASVVLTAVLSAVWRYTRVGWLTEAVAENDRTAAALGWSPNLISSGTWLVGSALAGLAGVLIAPISQLNVNNLSLLVIPALCAALIGGLRSFPLTLLGGVLVGVVQSVASNYVDVFGATEALPFLLIIVVLTIRGSTLPGRGYIADRLPAVGSGRVSVPVLAGAVAVVAALLLVVTSATWLAAIAGTFGVATVLLSLVVLVGYTGQLSLAQFALAGLGGLFAAHLVSDHWNFALSCVIAVIGATGIGVVFALPALRTRGVNLAVVTLGLGVAMQSLIFNNPDYTGSLEGVEVGSPKLFGWNIGAIDHPSRYAYFCFVLFVLAALMVANLRRGRTGRRLLAVRANERAAAAAGINVLSSKVYAFALGGGLAGLGGIMLTFTATTATFSSYSPLNSINAVADSVLGGVGFIGGAMTGATIAPQSIGSVIALRIQSIDLYLPLIGGVALLLTLLAAPNGQAKQMADSIGRLRRRFRRRETPGTALAAIAAAEPLRVAPKALTVDSVSVTYGRVVAVENLSLRVEPGEVLGLIGPNGAGKTSFMDAVTGFARCRGTVEVGDTPVSRWSASRRVRAGMTRSFQGLELFDDMTVLENLQAASEPRDLLSYVKDLVAPGHPPLTSAALAAVREFHLEDCLDKRPDELSFGQRRLVAIARACAGAPSVLLLDEPVAGLDDNQSAECATLVRRLAASWGMAILVIEHDMNFVMELCDRVVVIDFGREIATGTPAEISDDPVALAAYLGEVIDDPGISGDAHAPQAVQG